MSSLFISCKVIEAPRDAEAISMVFLRIYQRRKNLEPKHPIEYLRVNLV